MDARLGSRSARQPEIDVRRCPINSKQQFLVGVSTARLGAAAAQWGAMEGQFPRFAVYSLQLSAREPGTLAAGASDIAGRPCIPPGRIQIPVEKFPASLPIAQLCKTSRYQPSSQHSLRQRRAQPVYTISLRPPRQAIRSTALII